MKNVSLSQSFLNIDIPGAKQIKEKGPILGTLLHREYAFKRPQVVTGYRNEQLYDAFRYPSILFNYLYINQ
jgi:hypothetical protein